MSWLSVMHKGDSPGSPFLCKEELIGSRGECRIVRRGSCRCKPAAGLYPDLAVFGDDASGAGNAGLALLLGQDTLFAVGADLAHPIVAG